MKSILVGARPSFASCTPAGLPSTNNPHANFNKLLKEDGTAHVRLSCGGFLKCMKEELKL
jgi:hypothetical protein